MKILNLYLDQGDLYAAVEEEGFLCGWWLANENDWSGLMDRTWGPWGMEKIFEDSRLYIPGAFLNGET